MGCSDSKPNPPVENLTKGETLLNIADQWLMEGESRGSKQLEMVPNGAKFQFLEAGKNDEELGQPPRIRVSYTNSGGNTQEGWVDSFKRRGTTGNGPADSCVQRIAAPA